MMRSTNPDIEAAEEMLRRAPALVACPKCQGKSTVDGQKCKTCQGVGKILKRHDL